jgi:hypothetical protein
MFYCPKILPFGLFAFRLVGLPPTLPAEKRRNQQYYSVTGGLLKSNTLMAIEDISWCLT